jgi:hypothetical protein
MADMPAGAMRTRVNVERAVAGRFFGEASCGFGCVDRRVEDLPATCAKDEVGATRSPSGRGDVPHGGSPIEVGPRRPSIGGTIRSNGVSSPVTCVA